MTMTIFRDRPRHTVVPLSASQRNGEFEPGDAFEPSGISDDWLDWSQFAERKAPPREYFLDNWLPIGVGAGLYGAGGTGKSLIIQQMQSCGAVGKPFLGISGKAFRSIGVYSEDDPDELWRRQEVICADLRVPLSAMSAMRCQSRIGKENLLCTYEKGGVLKSTDLVNQIIADAKTFKANIVTLDNVAQMFGGNEISRTEVTQFGNLLSGMAKAIGGSVIVLGHPAKNPDSEYSGSTAWDASVRVRWLFGRPDPKELPANIENPDHFRVLRRAKANYDARDEIWLRWSNGVFVPFDRTVIDDAVKTAGEAEIENLRQAIAGACVIGETPLTEILPVIMTFTQTQDRTARQRFAEAVPEAPNGVDVINDFGERFRLYSKRHGIGKNAPIIVVKEALN